mmetsp:Transcript_13123/g.41366  ORF Transcript_13123/g.41366 Transcript_13123/m.41366 type:complete len:255 (+) Transcript_13123:320-1084(+)
MRAVVSREPEARRRPAGDTLEKSMDSTGSSWRKVDPRILPFCRLVKRMLESREEDAVSVSVANLMSVMLSWCSGSDSSHSPVLGAKRRMQPSESPVVNFLPSGVKTPAVQEPAWPPKTRMKTDEPDGLTDQIHAVPSSEPAARTLPLGCQSIHSMGPPGPSRAQTKPVDDASFCHTLTMPSRAADAHSEPAAFNLTRTTESLCVPGAGACFSSLVVSVSMSSQASTRLPKVRRGPSEAEERTTVSSPEPEAKVP